MEIEQQKFSNRHTFTFNSDSLNFAYHDKSGSGDVDIPYAELPGKSATQIDQNLWLRNVGYLWCVLGAVEIGFAFITQQSLSGFGLWLLMGFGCLLWTHFTKVTYSVFRCNRGRVLVIQDGINHDQIINEIRLRRKKQLLAIFGDIHLQNGFENEVAKFRWLAQEQIITTGEAERRIAQVQAALLTTGAAHPAEIN